MTDPIHPPGSLEEKIDSLLRDSSSRELTPLQTAFTRLTWVVVAATLISVGFIAWVWYVKLPPVPPLTASPDEISRYRELTDIAGDTVTKLVETVVAKVFFPILMLVAGIAVGRKVSMKSDE
jgi:hypothetical protein